MIRHYILTRAVYDPTIWDDAAIKARLKIFAGVTARSLAHQTHNAFTWLLAVHADDPYLQERSQIALDAMSDHDRLHLIPTTTSERGRPIAAIEAYQADWRSRMTTKRSDITLTTRIDDDDAFAPSAVERIHAAATTINPATATALIFPIGFRVYGGRYTRVHHETNAMSTIAHMATKPTLIYDHRHRDLRKAVPLHFIDHDPGWLWVRHDNTISGWRRAERPINKHLQNHFPNVDWDLIGTEPTVQPQTGGDRFR